MNGLKTDVIINRDALYALRELPEESVNCCVTSPPYYALRDYGLDMQIGREDTPEQYIDRLVPKYSVNCAGYCVLTVRFWLNIAHLLRHRNIATMQTRRTRKAGTADCKKPAFGCKQKDLIGIPWLLAFALRADGWYLRSDIIWQKENPMPESCNDRPSRCYEHIFLLTKSKKYYYDAAAIAEPVSRQNGGAVPHRARRRTQICRGSTRTGEGTGYNRARSGSYYDEALMPTIRNKRDVWLINTVPYKGGHFAAYPPKLAETCIRRAVRKAALSLTPFSAAARRGQPQKALTGII